MSLASFGPSHHAEICALDVPVHTAYRAQIDERHVRRGSGKYYKFVGRETLAHYVVLLNVKTSISEVMSRFARSTATRAFLIRRASFKSSTLT